MAASAEGDNPVGALERGLAILRAFNTLQDPSVQDLADQLQLSRSTAYRLIERLRDLGFLEMNAVTGRLRLGLEAMKIGVAALQSTDIMSVAPERLRLLSEVAEASANLAVFDVDRMVLLHREQGHHAITVSARLGSYRPMQASGLGKAYLAAMSDAECETLIASIEFKPYAPASIRTAATLRREVAEIRLRGYAIDDREFEPTLACCAAAVFDHRRMPVAAISVSGVAERILPRISALGPLVADTARAMSARLGWTQRG